MIVAGELPVETVVGRWWKDETVEIDVLAALPAGPVLVGECRWQTKPIGQRDLTELRRKAAHLSAPLGGGDLRLLVTWRGRAPVRTSGATGLHSRGHVRLIRPVDNFDGLSGFRARVDHIGPGMGEQMVNLDDHERRIGALEQQVEMEARLRAVQDSDQSGLHLQANVHARLLQAVGTTQSQHGRQLTRLENDMSEVKSDLGDVKSRLGGVETRLGGVETRLGGVETRLGGVETRLEVVETDLGVVKTDLGVVKTGVHTILGLLNRLVDDDEREH